VRAELAVRDALVRTRTRYVAIIKAAVRREGLRLTQGEPERTAAKLAATPLTEGTARELAPLVALLEPVTTGIADADRRLAGLARESAPARLLQTMPMIGPVTALGFVAALDDVARFEGPHQVAAYLGLVPSERSSGEQQHRGRITKRGDSRTRWLLVEAAWRIRRSKDPALAPRNAWAERIATRRGKRVAIVALARRLAGILLTMCRTGTPYAAARLRSALPSPAAA
jgi:transposase